MLTVLSLGGGVQSSALLLMSELGELPTLDAAVFADTGWEPAAVYQNLAWLKTYCKIPIYVVQHRNLRDDVLSFASGDRTKVSGYCIPLWTKRVHDGSKGMLNRQCTRDYKIRPINYFIKRELLGFKKYQRVPIGSVNQWLGISADEVRRVRISRDPWYTKIYPLCNLPTNYFTTPMTRADCLAWLDNRFPGRAFPRSACIGCPYHTNQEWLKIKEVPTEWEDAVGVDKAVRKVLRDGKKLVEADCFLHPGCEPLETTNLVLPIVQGKKGAECLGNCHT